MYPSEIVLPSQMDESVPYSANTFFERNDERRENATKKEWYDKNGVTNNVENLKQKLKVLPDSRLTICLAKY